MADVLYDDDHVFRDGSRMVIYARREPDCPGNVYYRMQYYDMETGETLLRYDNAHDSDVGHYHRHSGSGVEGIDFENIHDHRLRFLSEVEQIHANR